MSKPWFIDILTYVIVGLWFMLTYATMQQFGPSPWLLGSSVVMLVVGLLMIYGQRMTHFELGDRIVVDLRSPSGQSQDSDNEE